MDLQYIPPPRDFAVRGRDHMPTLFCDLSLTDIRVDIFTGRLYLGLFVFSASKIHLVMS